MKFGNYVRMKRENLLLLLILVIYVCYQGYFIYESSSVVDGKRYFVLLDDEMISMRYAKNLSGGQGLVWNPGGEKVEGYSNLLWVLFMAIFHFFPIDKSKISLCIQISGVIFLVLNLFYIRKIAAHLCHYGRNQSNSFFVIFFSIFLTAFYYPLNYWSIQGAEVSFLTLLISVAVWLILQCIENKNVSIGLYILLAIGTLLRLDMLVPSIGILAFLVVMDSPNRKKNLLIGISILGSVLILQILFRYLYYGDIFPNTYYLKITGGPLFFRVAQGFTALFQFIVGMNWVLFFLPFTILLYRCDRDVVLLFLLILFQLLYNIYVGGDAWEWMGGSNRFLSIIMPIFFILFALSLDGIVKALIQFGGEIHKLTLKFGNYSIVVFGIMSLVNFNAPHGKDSLRRWIFLDPPIHAVDNKKMIQMANLLNRITAPTATIAVVWAGILPYFVDRTTIDLLGKNDRKIAHEKIHKFQIFFPGHVKWDYAYSIGQLKPDVVVQVWIYPETAKQYLEKDYITLDTPGFRLSLIGDQIFLRKDSPNILWQRTRNLFWEFQ